jgi:hypothetical protein
MNLSSTGIAIYAGTVEPRWIQKILALMGTGHLFIPGQPFMNPA